MTDDKRPKIQSETADAPTSTTHTTTDPVHPLVLRGGVPEALRTAIFAGLGYEAPQPSTMTPDQYEVRVISSLR